MSDRYYAEIKIGGDIPKRLAEELLGLIRDECMEDLNIEIPEKGLTEEQAVELLKQPEGSIIEGRDPEAAYGEFRDLEEWLQENDIPFNRQSNSYAEYDPEEIWYRPGMKDTGCAILDQDGASVIKTAEVSSLIEAFEGLTKETAPLRINSDKSLVKKYASMLLKEGSVPDFLTLLKKRVEELSPEAPGLPPIHIID